MTDKILIKQLIRDEGSRLKAYKDSLGFWTIGVGHNFEADGVIDVKEALEIKNGITQAQLEAYLVEDLQGVYTDLTRNLPWWTTLSPVRQRVLANMCFNMGIVTLLKFKNTLDLIKRAQWAPASDNMLKSLWAKQVGQRAVRLAEQIKTGVDQ